MQLMNSSQLKKLAFLMMRLFTEWFNLAEKRKRAFWIWSSVEKQGSPRSNNITVTLLNFA